MGLEDDFLLEDADDEKTVEFIKKVAFLTLSPITTAT